MDTEKLLTGIGLAFGGYLAYESGLLSTLTGGLIPAPLASPVSSGGAGSDVSNAGGQPSNPTTQPPPTRMLVLQAAQAAKDPALQSFDAWNARYKQVRGIDGPAPDPYLTPATRNMSLSIDEWWADMQKAGFSGFGRYVPGNRGLGCLGCGMKSKGGFVRPGLGRWIYG